MASLEKKRQYRKLEPQEPSDGYGLVLDKKNVSNTTDSKGAFPAKHPRSRSPQREHVRDRRDKNYDRRRRYERDEREHRRSYYDDRRPRR